MRMSSAAVMTGGLRVKPFVNLPFLLILGRKNVNLFLYFTSSTIAYAFAKWLTTNSIRPLRFKQTFKGKQFECNNIKFDTLQ